ncbi:MULTISPECIES: hypothetical protein [unclassified Streptomyces]|uniref:hypothetical protein n=1 Tax=unclassified Streptomyces TaxID=2593676 RepID=UPI002B1E083A|nr:MULTISPECIES: hypothetical protein [unclassified Streptomyces]
MQANNAANTMDSAAAARHERFGKLPERVPYQDMVEVKPASPKESARDAYNPEGSWMSFSCLAADLAVCSRPSDRRTARNCVRPPRGCC